MNEVELVNISLKDFFTKKMLKFALLPLLFTLLVMYILFFSAAGYGLENLDIMITQVQNGQNVIIDENAPFYYDWANFLLQYSITAWLVGFLVYTVGIIFIMMFSVFLTLVIIGFLTPFILKVIHKRHYSSLPMSGHGSLLSPLFILIKSLFVMVFLFIILIPLYFIPFINIIAFNIPIYYFFHKLLNYDVASTILSNEEFNVIYKKEKNSFRIRTFLLYMLSLVPFITLFSAVFFVIYLGHGYFIELGKIKGNNTAIDKFLNN
ncbi:EI24 domain-containing protein [Malaciobacter mytili]|uniref:Membrane protein (Etoposide-induced protein domain) n=1 Tax=Malaciobacter mytili LMG 24559 TaxID=1032238 RepID=A0AAX2AFX0_9BACT|nr:EI24 domain-containing protein [Malaciobacter mytili]AXH15551.1 membrane protein (etoposide-induced protein domain) [Malaciobacter mytili LMG 24559]RXK15045.1 hypothetical protein CP985_10585 [Malaciobacter mytili LMG 24559]